MKNDRVTPDAADVDRIASIVVVTRYPKVKFVPDTALPHVTRTRVDTLTENSISVLD